VQFGQFWPVPTRGLRGDPQPAGARARPARPSSQLERSGPAACARGLFLAFFWPSFAIWRSKRPRRARLATQAAPWAWASKAVPRLGHMLAQSMRAVGLDPKVALHFW